MAVMTRKTLVLHGVSVVVDGLTVEARLGTGYQGNASPAPFSMRRPSSNHPQVDNPDPRRDLAEQRDAAAVRAGRPEVDGGFPSRSRAADRVRLTIAPRWYLQRGASCSTAARNTGLPACVPASVGTVPSGCGQTAFTAVTVATASTGEKKVRDI